MPPASLTRHFYRIDEVTAALSWCILRGRIMEAAFWAQELLDSGLSGLATETIRMTWCLGIGVRGTGWIRSLTGTAAVPVSLAVSMARARQIRDGSVGAILSLRAPEVIDEPVSKRIAVPPEVLGSAEEEYCARALLQGKTAMAWFALGTLESENRERILRVVGIFKHGSSFQDFLDGVGALELPERIGLALRVAAVAATPPTFQRSWEFEPTLELPIEVAETQQRWIRLVGRRARREIAIPVDCLYGLTERGCVDPYTSNQGEIMEKKELERGIGGVPDDDDELEAFYDERFPDDIPDEWSAKDRQMSHGTGVNAEKGVCRKERIIQKWMFGIGSSVLWGGVTAAAAAAAGTVRKTTLLDLFAAGTATPSRLKPTFVAGREFVIGT